MGRLPRHLYFWVLLAILAGGALGYVDPATAVQLKPLGDGFIALVKMLISPIIFCTVVLGIAGAGDMKKVGRVGGQGAALLRGRLDASRCSSAWWWSTRSGPAPASTSIPATLDAERGRRLREARRRRRPPADFILSIIPTTFLDAFTGSGSLLQVLFVAILFGYAMTHMGEARRDGAPVHRGVLAHLLRDDERADEAGADRRRRRDGVHHRPLRHRLAAAAGGADGQLLPDLRCSSSWSCSGRSPRSPASASCASSSTSRTSC